MIQQNVGGHPVAVYRFPPRTKFPGNSTLTVWAGSNDPILHQPPSDYVWKEQQKWGTGPECTTILCKPNGQVCYTWRNVSCQNIAVLLNRTALLSSPVAPLKVSLFDQSYKPVLWVLMVEV